MKIIWEKSVYISCCNKLRLAKAYELCPEAGCILKVVYYLPSCPTCSNASLVLKKFDPDYEVTEIRRKNEKARNFFDKLKPYITRCFKANEFTSSSNFWLHYNEFGSIKKSYANLSSLQMGLFEAPGIDPPQEIEKILIN